LTVSAINDKPAEEKNTSIEERGKYGGYVADIDQDRVKMVSNDVESKSDLDGEER